MTQHMRARAIVALFATLAGHASAQAFPLKTSLSKAPGLIFALLSFKPGVTLYALVVGLALAFRHALEPARLAFEVQSR